MPSRRNAPRVAWLACISSVAMLGGGACEAPEPPEHPVWADVEPIFRAQCSGCHGATANATGGGFRFDFFDMTEATCGKDVAAVLGGVTLAHDLADHIARAIISVDGNMRPSMPPLPAPYLEDNEWVTILRWTANPAKGDKPPGNRAPEITVDGTSMAVDETLDLKVIVSDTDGDPVAGVIRVGDQLARMDHAGAFSARFDTSSWPDGTTTLRALLCDGWSLVTADLLDISIHH